MKTPLKFLINPILFFICAVSTLVPLRLAGLDLLSNEYAFPPAYKGLRHPVSKVKLLLQHIIEIKEQNPSKALYYAQVADSLALESGPRFYSAQTAFWLAWLNHYEGAAISYQSALIDAQICLNRLRGGDPPYWRAKAHALVAAIYADQQLYSSAQKHLELALSLAPKVRLKTDSLELRGNLHSILAIMPKQPVAQAEQHFKQAINDYTAANASVATARVCRNYALQLLNKGQIAQADSVFQKSLKLYRQENVLDGLRKTLVYYANHWTERFNQSGDTLHFQRALNLQRQALLLNPDLETYFQTGYTYHCFVLRYNQHKNYPRYLDSVHYYYGLALQKITSSNDYVNIKLLAENIDKLSLISPYRYGGISDLVPAYERLLQAERRATEGAKWRLQVNERAKYYSELLNYVFIGISLLAIILFFGRRALLKHKKAKEQTYVQLLQTRLNPHFISNSLNSIDALVRLKKDRSASEYLVKFNRFCRNVLEASDQTFVSLQKELETLTWYLDLEKLRLGERLNYQFQVDEKINLRATQIPLFLLQPFLENAIWHGIHPKAEGGTVSLNLQKMPDHRIRIEIEDDGVGRSAHLTAATSNQDRRSWGKDISDERLKIFNGERGIPVDLQDGSNGVGTRVVIILNEHLKEVEPN